ncbi:MAG: hypothetical protein GY704_16485, partial [Phycisphaeraceae bacterium]|nr:hypothetical protein [Phycisphaeraceae bacterium]
EDLTLALTLPTLDLEELDINGELFQALTIPGGSLEGANGLPALPTITRLITVPTGAFVTPRVTATERTDLAGYRLLPMQPDNTDALVIDRAAYRTALAAQPAVEVGEPAIFRDLRVVPVTFRPVSYDPVAGKVTVAHRMEVAFTFSDGDDREPAPPAKGYIPSSFVDMYEDLVVNYGAGDAGRSAA